MLAYPMPPAAMGGLDVVDWSATAVRRAGGSRCCAIDATDVADQCPLPSLGDSAMNTRER
jgi:hypothetical protein